jgi:sialic acid synthase SpsE
MRPTVSFAINGFTIMPRHRPYLIAEISANHNGDFNRFVSLITQAFAHGADAVKLQCYDPETISADVIAPDGPWRGRSLRQLYREAHTPRGWLEFAFDWAKASGRTVFASVFAEADVDFLERFDPPAYKISSFDIVDLKLIQHVAQLGKPLFISTGGATGAEIMAADVTAGTCPHLFLHCISEYPTPLAEAWLSRIRSLLGFLNPPMVGLSDHSLGHDVAVAATALGVVAIEKHFVLSRMDGGPDSSFSMEPTEFAMMASAVRAIHAAAFAGPPEQGQKPSFYRKSLFYGRAIACGDVISETDLRTMRPNLGIHPVLLSSVVGRSARRDLAAGSPVSLDDLSSGPA